MGIADNVPRCEDLFKLPRILPSEEVGYLLISMGVESLMSC